MDRFTELVDIVRSLRGEDGCPWDRAQTYETLIKPIISETYEVVSAINKKDYDNLKEELGDFFLQGVFLSLMAEEEGRFSLDNVMDGINEKLIRRHPHVFTDKKVEHAEEALQSWESIKAIEKMEKSKREILDDVPHEMPSLMRSQEVIKKAYGKEIPENFETLLNLVKTWEKLNKEDKSQNLQIVGEILLEITKISQKVNINSEFALTNAIEQFINRFEGH